MVKKKKIDEDVTCSGCAYFCREEDDGECRRYPPVIVSIDDDGQGIQAFPIRALDDPKCGEYKNREH